MPCCSMLLETGGRIANAIACCHSNMVFLSRSGVVCCSLQAAAGYVDEARAAQKEASEKLALVDAKVAQMKVLQ